MPEGESLLDQVIGNTPTARSAGPSSPRTGQQGVPLDAAGLRPSVAAQHGVTAAHMEMLEMLQRALPQRSIIAGIDVDPERYVPDPSRVRAQEAAEIDRMKGILQRAAGSAPERAPVQEPTPIQGVHQYNPERREVLSATQRERLQASYQERTVEGIRRNLNEAGITGARIHYDRAENRYEIHLNGGQEIRNPHQALREAQAQLGAIEGTRPGIQSAHIQLDNDMARNGYATFRIDGDHLVGNLGESHQLMRQARDRAFVPPEHEFRNPRPAPTLAEQLQRTEISPAPAEPARAAPAQEAATPGRATPSASPRPAEPATVANLDALRDRLVAQYGPSRVLAVESNGFGGAVIQIQGRYAEGANADSIARQLGIDPRHVSSDVVPGRHIEVRLSNEALGQAGLTRPAYSAQSPAMAEAAPAQARPAPAAVAPEPPAAPAARPEPATAERPIAQAPQESPALRPAPVEAAPPRQMPPVTPASPVPPAQARPATPSAPAPAAPVSPAASPAWEPNQRMLENVQRHFGAEGREGIRDLRVQGEPGQRTVALRFNGELSRSEVASRLGLPEERVASNIVTAGGHTRVTLSQQTLREGFENLQAERARAAAAPAAPSPENGIHSPRPGGAGVAEGPPNDAALRPAPRTAGVTDDATIRMHTAAAPGTGGQAVREAAAVAEDTIRVVNGSVRPAVAPAAVAVAEEAPSLLGRMGRVLGAAGRFGRQIPVVGAAVGAAMAVPSIASAAVARVNGEISTGELAGVVAGEVANTAAGLGGFLTAEAGTQAIRRAQDAAGVSQERQVSGLVQLGQEAGSAIAESFSAARREENRRNYRQSGRGAQRIEGFDEEESTPAAPRQSVASLSPEAQAAARGAGTAARQQGRLAEGDTPEPAGQPPAPQVVVAQGRDQAVVRS